MEAKGLKRQCTAKSSRSGKRCNRSAILGGTVCATHGGSAPQVKKRAMLRLLALIDPALETMGDLLAAKSEMVKYMAAKDIMDRGGLKEASAGAEQALPPPFIVEVVSDAAEPPSK